MSPQSHTQIPQQHQDSGVSFSTPSQDPATIFNSPKDSGMLYQDAKMYSSPSQIHRLPDEQTMYQHSPLGNGTNGNELDMHNLGMYGTIDPNSLAQHQQQ